MTEVGFKSFKKDLRNHFWIFDHYEAPSNILTCWHINEEERSLAIKNQKPFKNSQSSTDYFKITKRIDSDFIEGHLGRHDMDLSFHNSPDFGSYTYFMDYKSRKKVYFTFDNIALYEVIEIIPDKPLRFILKRIENHKTFKKNQAFMIMPFHNESLDKMYFDNIRPFLKDELGITIYRADDFRNNDIIIDTIYKLIEESEFIIAETTIENKNSFYELGYAAAMGKEIIITQNKKEEQKLFFDRAHIRAIMYDVDDVETFKFDLKSTISAIRSRT